MFRKSRFVNNKILRFFANHADVNDVSFVIGWICFLHLEFTFISISPKRGIFSKKYMKTVSFWKLTNINPPLFELCYFKPL